LKFVQAFLIHPVCSECDLTARRLGLCGNCSGIKKCDLAYKFWKVENFLHQMQVIYSIDILLIQENQVMISVYLLCVVTHIF